MSEIEKLLADMSPKDRDMIIKLARASLSCNEILLQNGIDKKAMERAGTMIVDAVSRMWRIMTSPQMSNVLLETARAAASLPSSSELELLNRKK